MKHNKDIVIKQYVREVAQSKGFLLRDIAKELGITPQSLSTRLASSKGGYLQSYQEIANILGVPLWKLFYDPNEPMVYEKNCPYCNSTLTISIKP